MVIFITFLFFFTKLYLYALNVFLYSMTETIEVEIVRPVNPAGISFVKYLWGAVGSRNRTVLEKYRREFSRLIQKLGYKIEDSIGSGKMITGKIIVELEDSKPVRAKAVEIDVWGVEKKVDEEITAEIE